MKQKLNVVTAQTNIKTYHLVTVAKRHPKSECVPDV